MRPAIDITGGRFGRLTVIERAGSDDRNALWHCRCDCGTELTVAGGSLRTGHKKSCGCLAADTKPGNFCHGESKTPLYWKWLSMRRRCGDPKEIGYHRYGGRGIRVCDVWQKDYVAFREWSLGNGYALGLEIDRIDNDGDYCPENCRYITPAENRARTSRTHKHVYHGERLSISEAARRYGLNRQTVFKRLRMGYSPEEAIAPLPRNPALVRPPTRTPGN